MADRASKSGKKKGGAAPPPLDLPSAMFTGPGLMALADLLPVMTAFVDRGLVYRFMNTPLAEWLGKPRRDVIGRHMRDVLGERAFAEREPMLAAALEGNANSLPPTFDHPELGPVTAQSDYVPWVNPATGAVDGVVMVIADITEQRATEQALRESEARFKRIANSAPAMMWVTRLDRVRDFVNDAYVEFVGGPGSDRAAAGSSTGARGSTPTTSRGSSRRASPGRRRRTVHARGALQASRRRVALAAQRVAAAVRGGRGADRVHRGRERHHARQGGGARASPPGRRADPRAAP